MKAYNLIYKPFGKHAVLIEWPAKIDNNILESILKFKSAILKSNIKVIVNIINAYNSLTVFYNTTIENIDSEILILKSIFEKIDSLNIMESMLWKIPVCYDEKFGVDLGEISEKNKLTNKEVIGLHSGSVYTVYFIGFLPGFLFLGGLDKKLHFPRKANPRLHVEKGAVGIGGQQTGVYPQESSGGWNIIGNSPVNFFDRKKEQPCFAKAGDLVQFIPIDFQEHQRITNLVHYKRYKIEREVVNV